ncbi:MAG: hypothetical protein WAT12_02700, partial [Candidatus Nitrotoga sp.]
SISDSFHVGNTQTLQTHFILEEAVCGNWGGSGVPYPSIPFSLNVALCCESASQLKTGGGLTNVISR